MGLSGSNINIMSMISHRQYNFESLKQYYFGKPCWYNVHVHVRYSQKETPVLFSWEFSCNQLAHVEKALHAIGYNQIPTK